MKHKSLKTPLILFLSIIFIIIFSIFLSIIITNSIEKNTEHILGIINNTNEDTIYLSINETYQLNYEILSDKEESEYSLSYISSNPSAVSVDENGLITALKDGKSNISIIIDNYSETVNVISTSLILPIDNELIYDKPYLEANSYTKQDNDLIDELLEKDVNDAGIKTRAGAVAAARFLLLKFPYRINYFYENGRLSSGVDGEGRYYHKGLYLDESRFDNIEYVSAGKACWGSLLESYEEEEIVENGLDCSGFVSWVLLNGGYDPGDIGSGLEELDEYSFYNIADREKLGLNNIKDIKAGDLVHNDKASGHVGIVVGLDEDYIYVGQAIWYEPRGVVLTKYTYEEFVDDWIDVIFMDSYYKENGNYSDMW